MQAQIDICEDLSKDGSVDPLLLGSIFELKLQNIDNLSGISNLNKDPMKIGNDVLKINDVINIDNENELKDQLLYDN